MTVELPMPAAFAKLVRLNELMATIQHNSAKQTPVDETPDTSRWGFALLATGIPLLATGVFFMLIGLVGMIIVCATFGRVVVDPISPVVLFLGLGLSIAGGICIYIGRMHRAEGRKLADAASVLRAHRRVSFYQLAGKMDVSEAEAERVVARCLSLGILQGYVDREKNEFFTPEAILHAREISDCPTCHGPVDQLRFLGEEFYCQACGARL